MGGCLGCGGTSGGGGIWVKSRVDQVGRGMGKRAEGWGGAEQLKNRYKAISKLGKFYLGVKIDNLDYLKWILEKMFEINFL